MVLQDIEVEETKGVGRDPEIALFRVRQPGRAEGEPWGCFSRAGKQMTLTLPLWKGLLCAVPFAVCESTEFVPLSSSGFVPFSVCEDKWPLQVAISLSIERNSCHY